MPDSQVFGSWHQAVGEGLDRLLTEFKERQGRIIAVTGGREEVEVGVRCEASGVLLLRGVTVSGFRIVPLPRRWDDPGRRQAEKGVEEQLARLARRFENALEEWTRRIVELARWLRYSPPPPEAKRLEPWFEDDEQDEDSGPETIH